MPRPRILISWIGHADLRSLARTLPARERRELLAVVGQAETDAKGPISTLLGHEEFDEVHLLSNYPSKWNKRLASSLATKPKVHRVDLKNPTDYSAIFEIAAQVLARITANGKAADRELCIHLSPGTPAMAGVWILLGKTRYPATFYQSFKGRVWKTEIPFDITVDLIPDILREPDAHFQHLASKSPGEVHGFEDIVGNSSAIRLVVGIAQRAAMRSIPVLLLGESGTGKEMFARAIHNVSPRRDGPIVAVNCAAIPESLLESELFGYTKGAYTGATKDHAGRFKEADGGTLFLDEIGECSADMQSKLLRVLQPPPNSGPCTRVFRPVGAAKDAHADVRVIAATNRDLITKVQDGEFREDLYYRLAVVSITLPPLRDRRADTALLAQHLLDRINQEMRHDPGYEHKNLSPSANAFVKRFHWPGNVRQLHNSLLQAAAMCDGSTVSKAAIEATVAKSPRNHEQRVLDLPLGGGFCLDKLLEDTRKHYLERAMDEAGGVKTRAAQLLGMKSYQTLDAQLTRLGIGGKQK